jgi:hypothetical protein
MGQGEFYWVDKLAMVGIRVIFGTLAFFETTHGLIHSYFLSKKYIAISSCNSALNRALDWDLWVLERRAIVIDLKSQLF